MRSSVLVLVALISSPAFAAADQFDLLCTGRLSDGKAIQRHYHVDLNANRWCVDECTVKPLSEVSSGQIVFVETKEAYRGDPARALDYVNRTTGQWSFFTSYWMGDGTCQPAPFSGFPAPPTKF